MNNLAITQLLILKSQQRVSFFKLADLTGMDESKLKRIFIMHQEIRLSEFDVICRALGVSAASVLSDIEIKR